MKCSLRSAHADSLSLRLASARSLSPSRKVLFASSSRRFAVESGALPVGLFSVLEQSFRAALLPVQFERTDHQRAAHNDNECQTADPRISKTIQVHSRPFG